MQKRESLNIEELLEIVGSQERPGDSKHRYQLRRQLLCSRYFEGTCQREQQWNKILSYTAPLVAGGLLVAMFAFVGNSITDPAELQGGANVPVASESVQNNFSFAVETPEEPFSEFIDYGRLVPVERVVKFVPIQTVSHTLVR